MLSQHKNKDFIPVQKGVLVKIALGGALYSMGQYVTSVEEAKRFAEQMQASQNDFLCVLNHFFFVFLGESK